MRSKQLFSIFLSVLLMSIFLPAVISADNSIDGDFSIKDEVIYGKLSPAGKVNHMYVVNSFYETKEGKITDIGKYKELRNLTDLSPIEQTGDVITFEATENEFYYQGELEKNVLPWHINIKYFLDGVETKAEDLAGKSGTLEIQIDVSENKEVDPIFFDYYLLQISLTFDPLYVQQIEAPKGTEAKEGKNKMINFSAMPGQEEIFITTANIQDFEMDPISISAVPANLAIDDPDVGDMKDDMKTLADAIKDVHDGVAALNNGVQELADGTGELKDGSNQFLSGLQRLDESSSELVNGSKQILDAFQKIEESLDIDINLDFDLPDVDDLKELPELLKSIGEQVDGFAELFNSIDEAISDIPENPIDTDDISELRQFLEDQDATNSMKQNFEQLTVTYHAAQAVKQLSESVPGELGAGAEEIANYIFTLADELDKNLQTITSLDEFSGLDELTEMQDGLLTMTKEYSTFHNGLVEYTKGVGELATNYIDLDQGINELNDGTHALKNGVDDLQDGTKELQKETKNLPDDMQSEIDEFMEDFDFSGFEAKSFVAEENKNIGVVQFVLQTEPIELPESDDDDSTEEETKSIWQRFLDLFR